MALSFLVSDNSLLVLVNFFCFVCNSSGKPEWKKFIDNLKIPSIFLHKDEFFEMLKTHPHKIANSNFPAIYLHKEEKLSQILASDEINQAKALKELMNLVEKKPPVREKRRR